MDVGSANVPILSLYNICKQHLLVDAVDLLESSSE